MLSIKHSATGGIVFTCLFAWLSTVNGQRPSRFLDDLHDVRTALRIEREKALAVEPANFYWPTTADYEGGTGKGERRGTLPVGCMMTATRDKSWIGLGKGGRR